jgi:hypothetical protein
MFSPVDGRSESESRSAGEVEDAISFFTCTETIELNSWYESVAGNCPTR